MLKKTILIIYLFSLLSVSAVYSKVLAVKDLCLFEKEIQSLDHDSLILFDIDYTILTPEDAALKPCGKGLRKKFLHNLDPQKRARLQSILGIDGKEELVDQKSPFLIQNIQARGIPVIALTALETGTYGKIINMEDWRLNRLKHFGIDFTVSFQDFNPLYLTELSPYNDHYPLFKNGVLFTNLRPKGEVLTTFLRKIDWKPTKLLFIDDSLSQIQSVESAAEALGIEFIGFHYTATGNASCKLNQTLGEFQFQYLIENEKWLPDKEAIKIFKNTTPSRN